MEAWAGSNGMGWKEGRLRATVAPALFRPVIAGAQGVPQLEEEGQLPLATIGSVALEDPAPPLTMHEAARRICRDVPDAIGGPSLQKVDRRQERCRSGQSVIR